MDPIEMKSILEGLIFSSESPVPLESLIEILPESSEETILEIIRQIEADCSADSRGVELVTVAGGYQFRTKGKCAQWIQRLKKTKPPKLSRSALETLAIVAYRQPIIRPTTDGIRGVDSGWVLR